MTKAFKVGDRVSWNSEAGRVSGTIIRVHTRDVEHKGYTHHANPDVPQYAVKSAKTATSHSTRARRSQSFATDAAVVARRDR
jgi:hypothetical protein